MSAGDWKELYLACERGDIETVGYQLRRGVDPNYQHPEFMSTVLFASIKSGRGDIVRLLLDSGADPALKTDLENVNAWEAAELYGRPDIVAILGKKPD